MQYTSVPKRTRHPSSATCATPLVPPPMWLPLSAPSPEFPPPVSTPASAQTIPSFSPCLLNTDTPVCSAAAAVSLSLAAIDASLGVCTNPSPDVALNALSADDINISTSLVSHPAPPPPPPPPSSIPWLPLPASLPLPPIEEELDVAIATARSAQKEQEMSIDRILRIAATSSESGLYDSSAQKRAREDDDAVSASSTISCSVRKTNVKEENSMNGSGGIPRKECVLERLKLVEQQLEESNGSSTTVTSPPLRRGRGGRISKRRRVKG